MLCSLFASKGLVFKFYSCKNEKALKFSTSTVFTILIFSMEGQAELQYLVVFLDSFLGYSQLFYIQR